jgi:FkbM family methyltransferase
MLLDKKKRYLNEGIHTVKEKYEYTDEMFKTHRHLFEYPELIKNSPIKEIVINNEDVIFTINNKGMSILITCDRNDANSLPMSYLNFTEYEKEEAEMILKLIKPRSVVFDIGANIGWYTLNILLKHKGASVYSFEPIPSSYRYLIKNLALNGQKTNKVYNIGFSDENKKIKFYFDMKCAMASSMADLREDKNTISIACTVKRMDDFISSLRPLKKLDFIKCDVEGAELFVFKGAIQTIKKYKPIVFSEMLRKWSAKFNYHPNEIINLFKGIGYRCFTISGKKLAEFFQMDDQTTETNFFFLHPLKHKSKINNLMRQK